MTIRDGPRTLSKIYCALFYFVFCFNKYCHTNLNFSKIYCWQDNDIMRSWYGNCNVDLVSFLKGFSKETMYIGYQASITLLFYSFIPVPEQCWLLDPIKANEPLKLCYRQVHLSKGTINRVDPSSLNL